MNQLPIRSRKTFVLLDLTICLIVFITLVWIRSSSSRQSRDSAIQYVISNGGSVAYSPSENIVLMLLGVNKPTYIQFDQLEGKNIDFSQVAALGDVDTVQLTNSCNIDTALPPLTTLPKLRLLILTGSDVTADGIEHFEGNESIEAVHLEKVAIDDRMMEILATLPNLQYLVMDSATLDPDSLNHFTRHQQLQSLSIPGTPISDGDVEVLLSLPGLTIIRCGTHQFNAESSAKLRGELSVVQE